MAEAEPGVDFYSADQLSSMAISNACQTALNTPVSSAGEPTLITFVGHLSEPGTAASAISGAA
jgi:hypothetical protein